MALLTEFTAHLALVGRGDDYAQRIVPFLRYCETKQFDLATITLSQIEQFLFTRKQQGLKDASLNMETKSIKYFYKFLHERNYCSSAALEATQKLQYIRIPKTFKPYLTESEFLTVLHVVQNLSFYWTPYKSRAILMFMFYSGIRKGELIALTRKDINLDECEAIIRVPNKTKKEGKICFSPKTRDALKEYFTSEPETQNAFSITEEQLDYFFSDEINICHKLDKWITPHMMRHSFGMFLAENGVPVERAQVLLRHASLSSTLIYYHVTYDMAKVSYQNLFRNPENK